MTQHTKQQWGQDSPCTTWSRVPNGKITNKIVVDLPTQSNLLIRPKETRLACQLFSILFFLQGKFDLQFGNLTEDCSGPFIPIKIQTRTNAVSCHSFFVPAQRTWRFVRLRPWHTRCVATHQVFFQQQNNRCVTRQQARMHTKSGCNAISQHHQTHCSTVQFVSWHTKLKCFNLQRKTTSSLRRNATGVS